LVILRDEDIFGDRTHTEIRAPKKLKETRIQQQAFADLQPGDLVVHLLHGVGIYDGLKKITLQGLENEFIQLRYKDGDKLYLPVYRAAQIQKYTGLGGQALLDKLGTQSWQKAKIKVKNALKDLASELLSLYSKRAASQGFAFSTPDQSFREFESTFPYDETPDQEKAIEDVIDDMVKPRPMDRLVCGDVGFGKTEVAVRAAYKAAQDGKQTAVLVPTTVLAFQHSQTFTKRFSETGVRVEMISRFVSPKNTKAILKDVAEGKVDILIGTHRLLSRDVHFKNLGLLVVDEEQRLGVTHKEKIKKLKTQIDVLTLSATPIPRTLNLSLMGIRDLSLISTPPMERMSTRTFISRYNSEIIRKAIDNELQRGGQVFVVHNRVQSINEFASEIQKLVPAAKIRVGHGQMAEEDLEKVMVDFYNHEFDVLVSTTIIESGLDIPRANTMIIDRADTFGLSQLYQLRGRIGRSKERAYAYLLLPAHGQIDPTAQERLRIIQKYSELGSGFQIAHHDLELRGSGNILGDDQSGHISAVGYELYMDLLSQALQETKGEPVEEAIEPDINLKVQALIPDTYIEDIRIRLMYYRMLGEIKGETDLDRIEEELVDRFGEIPEPVTNLFGIMLIRQTCKELGVRDISQGPKNLSLAFTNSTSASPEKMVQLVSKKGAKYQLTPDQRLIVKIDQISWQSVLEELKTIKNLL
ncbi:MAG: transcription-repair coupling factor, partial [Oligoflexia bacterium]|nr:transcription-repair coupling factor [Oligoflexia bacterium]